MQTMRLSVSAFPLRQGVAVDADFARELPKTQTHSFPSQHQVLAAPIRFRPQNAPQDSGTYRSVYLCLSPNGRWLIRRCRVFLRDPPGQFAHTLLTRFRPVGGVARKASALIRVES